jgi:lactate dehydrogenase-like 2-hydroxyacid dehydrogenase|tara:strand:- start:97 stop:876 length:780 start_codon:yes stop_codon:yes gene_type:complete
VGVENIIPNAHVVGAMEKSDHISVEDIKVISTKFTKVGKTMLERYPNLQWVVHRAHGTDGINLELCEKYGVGVVTTSPHTEACATWIKDRLVYGNTIIFGNGSISKRVQEIIDEWYLIEGLEYSVVNSSVKVININNHYKNVVSCVPLNDETENMFNYELFKNVNDMNFVSISRDKTHNNKDLLKLIKENKFKKLYIDTLGTEHREELIDTGIVDYTKHTAWVSEKDDLLELKTIIQDCLADDVTNPILERRKNVFFQF